MNLPHVCGKYELIERLGAGGVAEVFLARAHGEAGFSKLVVIKRLHPDLSADRHFVEMLIDEARITSRLTHSNICQVLDLGTDGGQYYLAIEFVPGEDLFAILRRCHNLGVEFPLDAAVYTVCEMLSGLDYAHRMCDSRGQPFGIVHRDISPQNIIVSFEGEVKIIDFGIAKARERRTQTTIGMIKGKTLYMSPEQASGHPVDHRSDIFAAAVVLHDLLRGGAYAQESDEQVVLKMRQAGFGLESLRAHRHDLSAELEALIEHAVAASPDDRFSSAGEFRRSLLTYLRRNGVNYEALDLAALMRQLFDAPHRRRKSGIRDAFDVPPRVERRGIREPAHAPRAAAPGPTVPLIHRSTVPVHISDAVDDSPLPITPQPAVQAAVSPNGLAHHRVDWRRVDEGQQAARGYLEEELTTRQYSAAEGSAGPAAHGPHDELPTMTDDAPLGESGLRHYRAPAELTPRPGFSSAPDSEDLSSVRPLVGARSARTTEENPAGKFDPRATVTLDDDTSESDETEDAYAPLPRKPTRRGR